MTLPEPWTLAPSSVVQKLCTVIKTHISSSNHTKWPPATDQFGDGLGNESSPSQAAISKGMWAAKNWTDQILHFLTRAAS